MASIIFLLGIFMILLFACIGVDVAHFVSASTEMQTVADAAAMAGCYELTWASSAAQMTAATAAAQNMVAKSNADLYSSSGIQIPLASVSVSFQSLNGGTNNAITVTVNPPVAFLFAPFIGAGGKLAGGIATAEQLPVLAAPSPPWFLETTTQGGPDKPPPLPQAAPPAPTTFPTSAYVTFTDLQTGPNSIAPPILPTYWIDIGISNLSDVNPNPNGVAQLIKCLGICQDTGTCQKKNPIVINGSTIEANHGAYNASVSNPDENHGDWTGGDTTILPITENGNVVGIYTVRLKGPFVPGSAKKGQGVYGELQVEFIGSASGVPGVVTLDPTTGGVFNNVGSTVAQLIK